jgi:tetratricopeptide (TPR) repeat protein
LEDADAVRLRHARYYVGVAAAAQRFYLTGGPATLTGLALLDQERPHIHAGWSWAQSRAGNQDADALLHDYAEAGEYIGDLRYDDRRERIPQLEAALSAARRRNDRYAEGARLGNLGNTYAALGDARQAITYHEQALVIAREIGDRRGEGAALGNLGIAYADLGNALQAIPYHEQRLAIAREVGDRRGEGAALGHLGNAYKDLGDARQAITYHEQRLAIADEIGDRRGQAIASWHLGRALEQQGDLARATQLMKVRVEYEQEIGHRDAEKHAAQLAELRQRLAGGAGGRVAKEGETSTMSDAGEDGG